jgi:hypothetical protein
MALLLQDMVLPQPMALLKHIANLRGPPAELPVGPPAVLSPPVVLSSTPRGLVRRPTMFLARRMPRARGSGTRLPARLDVAICASNTLMPRAVTATTSRARLQKRSEVDYHVIRLFSRHSRDPAPTASGGVLVSSYGPVATPKRNRAASLRHSIAPSHSAHASIVALDRDGPTATEPSSFVRVVVAVASVVPLTVCRSPGIDADATRSYVHTLSQTWRWHCHGHCANESQCNQCSRDQHGLSSFSLF